MSCSSTCTCGSTICPSRYASWFPRIGFGLVLVGYGLNHYRNLSGFVEMSKGVFPGVPVVGTVAGLLAYIVPALMIVGGALFAVRQLGCISKTCILAALGGILGWAGLAVLVGDGNAAGSMMPLLQNASVLLILYYIIKKMSCCGSSCACPPGACACPSTPMSK